MQTIAEQIAHAYDDDGQNWTADISLAISGMILPKGETNLEDACQAVGVEHHYREADADRYEFADGSAIVTTVGGWDVGFTGEALDCVCWPEGNDGQHLESCERWERSPSRTSCIASVQQAGLEADAAYRA